MFMSLLDFSTLEIKKQLDPTSPRSPAVAGSNGTSHDFSAHILDNGDDPAVTSGNFFEVLTSSELYKNTKVNLLSLLINPQA